jgi:hypothetical protein
MKFEEVDIAVEKPGCITQAPAPIAGKNAVAHYRASLTRWQNNGGRHDR